MFSIKNPKLLQCDIRYNLLSQFWPFWRVKCQFLKLDLGRIKRTTISYSEILLWFSAPNESLLSILNQKFAIVVEQRENNSGQIKNRTRYLNWTTYKNPRYLAFHLKFKCWRYILDFSFKEGRRGDLFREKKQNISIYTIFVSSALIAIYTFKRDEGRYPFAGTKWTQMKTGLCNFETDSWVDDASCSGRVHRYHKKKVTFL